MTYILYDYSNTHEFHRRAMVSAVSAVNCKLESPSNIAIVLGTRNMLRFLPKVLFLRAKCVVNIVGFGRLYTDYGLLGKLIFFAVIWIYSKTGALAFIVEHDTDKKVLKKIINTDVYTTHGSGLDVSEFSVSKKHNSTKLRLGYLSRFGKSKGTREILQIANVLPDDKELIVAGWDIQGNYFANSFSQLATHRSNISFLGRLNARPEISEFMSQIDVFLSPSVREGGNISLQEAIWHRVPFVTTDVPGCDVLSKLFNCPAIPLDSFADFVLSDKLFIINKDTSSWLERLKPFLTDSVRAEFQLILLDICIKHPDLQIQILDDGIG